MACEYCDDTGWYGQGGPGPAGNGEEWQRCDECKTGKAQIYIERLLYRLQAENVELKAKLEAVREWIASEMDMCGICGNCEMKKGCSTIQLQEILNRKATP